jgi:transcriptional regulator with XRE-family HTH domain
VKPAQVRMARAALNWSLSDLAKAAGVHRNTVSNFETGKFAGDPEKLAAMRRALESAGVEFTNGAQPGVRLATETGKFPGSIWTIPTRYGCQCVDLATGKICRVLIVEVFKDFVERNFNRLDCGAGNVRVLHFALETNVRISESVNRFLSKRQDGGPRFFAAYYGDLPEREFKRILEAADSTNELLRDVRHSTNLRNVGLNVGPAQGVIHKALKR